MAALLDTNILLRLLQPHYPHCPIAEQAINVLRKRNEVLHVTAQNLVEFWAATTRPMGENGLGFTVVQAAEDLKALNSFSFCYPSLRCWRNGNV